MPQMPRGREKNISGQGKEIYRRGEGLGSGPVGNQQGYQGRGENSQGFNQSINQGSGQAQRGSSRGISPIGIIIALILLLGGGGGIGSILGGSGGSSNQNVNPNANQNPPVVQQSQQLSSQMINSLMSGSNFSGNNYSSGWSAKSNNGVLDRSVNPNARKKYTSIIGNNKDTVTIMIYMCGADLESRSGMATSDIQEIISSNISNNPNVNVLLYTGGSSKWQNSVVSNRTTQIYKLESGGVRLLESDMGNVSMTDPETLTKFIKYGKQNYLANRMELIFWDHGGGSISGYGYDENFRSSGAMCLEEISKALEKGGVKFDFIGFDACLMATVENGLMLNPYADYLIASEETEPGVGWYYTNWLNQLCQNTSIATIDLGKTIADDFVSFCAQKCRGQKTTLSVIDLAELNATVPKELSDFANSTLELMQNDGYTQVAKARSGAREFAASNKIDQVDLVSLASGIKTTDGTDLAKAILGAVKYNRTSSDMTDAYGLSIYFPYRKASMVSSAVNEYDAIGMDSDYAEVIKKFASIEVGGQAVSGGSSSPLPSLTTTQNGSYTNNIQSYSSADMITQLLMQMMSGQTGNVYGLTSSNSNFLGKSLDPQADARFLEANRFDASNLVWFSAPDGTPAMYLSEEQWSLVTNLELNLFYDDGKGYIDMGLDNVYEFRNDGGLVGEFDGTWLAINNQPVAYYHMNTVYNGNMDYTITGRVPAKLNGQRVNLILVFDNENPYGYVAGAAPVYSNGETDTVSKNLIEITTGDRIDFLCDYYSYSGKYQDSYMLGDSLTVNGELSISNVYINKSAASAAYRFTDIYQQTYWSPVMY